MPNQSKSETSILQNASDKYFAFPALADCERTISYHEFNNIVNATAKTLYNLGVRSGFKVAIISSNNLELPIIFFALFKLGAISAPINNRFTAEGINSIINLVDPEYIILSDKLHGIKSGNSGILMIDDIIEFDITEDKVDYEHVIDGKKPGTIFFTSGTTGEPAGVYHDLHQHIISAEACNKNVPFEVGDKWLLSLPLFHIGGFAILVRAVVNGGCVLINSKDEITWDFIKEMNITHISMVPTQLFRLLDSFDKNKTNSLKAILLGGASIPFSLLEKLKGTELPVYATYGSTELASQAATSPILYTDEDLEITAKILDHCEMKTESTGEILVRSGSLFKGYMQKVAEKRIPFDKDGWFATGDLGEIDSSGNLKISGRKDNMFISAGENIQPEIIEKRLSSYKGIIEALVVPLGYPEYGSVPVAFVKTDSEIDFEYLKKWVREALPGIMVPKYILELPDNIQNIGIKSGRKELIDTVDALMHEFLKE